MASSVPVDPPYLPPQNFTLPIKLLTTAATTPTRCERGAAAYDLYSIATTTITPGARAFIPTGLALELPIGIHGRIAARRGLSAKHNLDISAEVITSDFRGKSMS